MGMPTSQEILGAYRSAAEGRWGNADSSKKLTQTAKQGLHPEVRLLKEIGINMYVQTRLLADILEELKKQNNAGDWGP